MSYWTVAQTLAQREHIARVSLTRSGFQTYAPLIKTKNERTALLFPRYLFVRIVDRWYPILSSMGVSRVLMSGDGPARVPDRVMDSLRGREGRDGFVHLPPPRQPRRGQRVKIIRGSFEGHLAIHDGMCGRDRQRVLLQLLGQTVTVVLPKRDVWWM